MDDEGRKKGRKERSDLGEGREERSGRIRKKERDHDPPSCPSAVGSFSRIPLSSFPSFLPSLLTSAGLTSHTCECRPASPASRDNDGLRRGMGRRRKKIYSDLPYLSSLSLSHFFFSTHTLYLQTARSH